MPDAYVDPNLFRNISIFGPLDDVAIEQVINAPENKVLDFKPKEYIIREQEEGDSMFVILDGSVEILIRGGDSGRVVGNDQEVPISTLHRGDFFGEQALMPGSQGKRNASARALNKCKVFRISKKYVDLNIKRDLDLTITQITMVELPQDKEVREILENMRLFKSLNKDEIDNFRSWTEVIEFLPEEVLLKEGDTGDFMYVVLAGEVEIFVELTPSNRLTISTLKRGNYFGEFALLPGSGSKRSACVKGKQAGRVVKIPKKYFRLLLKRDTVLEQAVKTVSDSRMARIGKAKQKS